MIWEIRSTAVRVVNVLVSSNMGQLMIIASLFWEKQIGRPLLNNF